MKALVYNPDSTQTSFLQITEITKPVLKNNNAIVKVLGVGVCGSDLLKLNRGLVKAGAILGHEMVGIIDDISSEMSERYDLKKGDRIVSSHHVPCLECDYCLRGQESLCAQFKSTNFNPGAFCEYLELSEGHLKHTVLKVPAHLTDEVVSFTEPVACCLKAAERALSQRSTISQRVPIIRHCEEPQATKQSSIRALIIGLGSIGLIMGQVVKHHLANAEVTGLDLLEERLKLAKELGFDKTVASLQGAGNDEFDYIFLCAGSSATIDLAIKHARNGATIVVFSSVADASKAFTNNDIYYKELTILGSYSPNLSNLRESLELISSGKIKVEKLITHRASLKNLGESIKLCGDKQGIKSYLAID